VVLKVARGRAVLTIPRKKTVEIEAKRGIMKKVRTGGKWGRR
jgi:hypothetical protein